MEVLRKEIDRDARVLGFHLFADRLKGGPESRNEGIHDEREEGERRRGERREREE
jgi:hypothetical protein